MHLEGIPKVACYLNAANPHSGMLQKMNLAIHKWVKFFRIADMLFSQAS